MKKITLLFVAVSAAFTVSAQNFTIEEKGKGPSKLIADSIMANNYHDYQFEMIPANSNDTLQLDWEVFYDDFPSTWDYSFCDYSTCYTPYNSGFMQMWDAFGSNKGFVKLTVSSDVDGVGTIKIAVQERGKPNTADTATYIITSYSWPASVNENKISGKLVKAYPNPAKNVLNLSLNKKLVQNQVSTQVQVEVFNIVGNKVKNIQVTGSGQQVDVSKLSSGVYFLRYRNLEGKLESQKFIKY